MKCLIINSISLIKKNNWKPLPPFCCLRGNILIWTCFNLQLNSIKFEIWLVVFENLPFKGSSIYNMRRNGTKKKKKERETTFIQFCFSEIRIKRLETWMKYCKSGIGNAQNRQNTWQSFMDFSRNIIVDFTFCVQSKIE